MKPTVFVGSSKEGLPIAHAIQEELEFDAEMTVWQQNIFDPGRTTLENLQSALLRFDFAVFVLSPDDRLLSRGVASPSARDNVIFELGLFIGRLGRDRVFFVLPRGAENVHVPTDLLGINALTFDPARSDANLRASLGAACNRLRQVFRGSAQVRSERAIQPAMMPGKSEFTLEARMTIEEALSRFRGSRTSPAVLFGDLDRFSAINRWFGIDVCNQVIESVEGMFAHTLRDEFSTRFGGDQFLSCISDHSRAKEVVKTLVRGVSSRDWGSIAPGLFVTMSMGTAIPKDGESVTDWVVRAIHGCIEAKKDGGNCACEGPTTLGRGISRVWADYSS